MTISDIALNIFLGSASLVFIALGINILIENIKDWKRW